MMGGQLRDCVANGVRITKRGERARHRVNVVCIDSGEGEAHPRRRHDCRIRVPRILERPADEALREVVRERGVPRPFGAHQQDDDALPILDAHLEELFGKHVIPRVRCDEPSVAYGPERLDPPMGERTEPLREVVREDLVEEHVFAGEVFVEVADRRAGALRDGGHRRRGEPDLREERCGGRDESRAHVFFGVLGHGKRERYILF